MMALGDIALRRRNKGAAPKLYLAIDYAAYEARLES